MVQAITHICVRYVETDRMGIVHHSNYLPWFEIGRGDYFGQTGMSYLDVEERGIWLPLLESGVKYHNASRYTDRLLLKTWIDHLTGAKITFNYEITRAGERIATGFTTHAFTTPALKPVNLKKANPEIWNALYSLYTQEG